MSGATAIIYDYFGHADVTDGIGLYGAPGSTFTSLNFKAGFVDGYTYRSTGLTINQTFTRIANSGGTTSIALAAGGIDSISSRTQSGVGSIDVGITGASGIGVFPNYSYQTGFMINATPLALSQRTGSFVIYQGAASTFGTLTIDRVHGFSVPEPATWAMMIVGFGAIGAAIRPRRRVAAVDLVAA